MNDLSAQLESAIYAITTKLQNALANGALTRTHRVTAIERYGVHVGNVGNQRSVSNRRTSHVPSINVAYAHRQPHRSCKF
jgi:hypothetical protein